MKQSKIIPAIFLICFLQISCTEKIKPDIFGRVETTLNSTELILKGRWYLRSMATADTIYQDSIFNRKRQIEFTSLSSTDSKMPILVDSAALVQKGTPVDISFHQYKVMKYHAFYGPYSGTLEIIYSYWFFGNYIEYVPFQITSLSSNKLILSDTIQKKEWTFYR